jgi:hypothetical protein
VNGPRLKLTAPAEVADTAFVDPAILTVVVDIGSRRVLVYRAGRVLRRYDAIVGKPSTPTPRGDYFVEENIRLGAELVVAPFALALRARSRVLQEFAGARGRSPCTASVTSAGSREAPSRTGAYASPMTRSRGSPHASSPGSR